MNGATIEREDDEVVVRIPMTLKKRMGRKEVIVPERFDETPVAEAQEPLVRALARAHAWQEALETGRYASVGELAEALGVDRRYVGRILNLAALAPEIVEAIVAGREASGVSLEQLVKGFPLAWEEQRAVLGFEPDQDGSPAGR